MINLAIAPMATEMEQQQTNCQEEGKQKCSNVLNLASTHFFNLVGAPLIAKMGRVAINKSKMKKRHKKSMEA
jgi:hypothetical protein